jgi:hypothetical protein
VRATRTALEKIRDFINGPQLPHRRRRHHRRRHHRRGHRDLGAGLLDDPASFAAALAPVRVAQAGR